MPTLRIMTRSITVLKTTLIQRLNRIHSSLTRQQLTGYYRMLLLHLQMMPLQTLLLVKTFAYACLALYPATHAYAATLRR